MAILQVSRCNVSFVCFFIFNFSIYWWGAGILKYTQGQLEMTQSKRILQHQTTTGYDVSRKCFVTVPIDERGVICPHQKYMGLTNIILNIVKCINLARDVCHHGTAYVPLQIQHAVIDDLFDRSAWQEIGVKYNVTIHFYCDDNTITNQRGVLNGRTFLQRIHTHSITHEVSWSNASVALGVCVNKTLFVQDAMSTKWTHGNKSVDRRYVNEMILMMTKHLSPTLTSYIQSIRTGLMRYNKTYTVLHLRFESDTWTLITFRETAFDNPFMFEKQVNEKLNNDTTWYGTGIPLKHFGRRKTIHYKREFMDESKVVTPYITGYWNMVSGTTQYTLPPRVPAYMTTPSPIGKGRKILPQYTPPPTLVNVTNSTGALIDFVMALYAPRSVLAKFSSFGNQLASLRCNFNIGEETWVYRTNYKLRRIC
eukprot:PhF_6_TR6261/c0_g1_i1/m.9472